MVPPRTRYVPLPGSVRVSSTGAGDARNTPAVTKTFPSTSPSHAGPSGEGANVDPCLMLQETDGPPAPSATNDAKFTGGMPLLGQLESTTSSPYRSMPTICEAVPYPART